MHAECAEQEAAGGRSQRPIAVFGQPSEITRLRRGSQACFIRVPATAQNWAAPAVFRPAPRSPKKARTGPPLLPATYLAEPLPSLSSGQIWHPSGPSARPLPESLFSACHPLVRSRGWIIPRSRSAEAAPARGVEGHSLGRDPSAGSAATEDGGEAKACNEHAGRLTVAVRSLLKENLCAD